ncbi:MAG: hypothetical protein QG670_2314 [Thermoproteota archaeon]|nr:hypothetical protein [Thermoproteota archaeon]
MFDFGSAFSGNHPDEEPNSGSQIDVDGLKGEYASKLDSCKNFQEVFILVKKSVKESLGLERVGLMLYLMDLPLNLGAFHEVGSNGIVMNRTLLEQVMSSTESKREVNSFVYSILLHEYIHTLGCLDEGKTRQLTYTVSRDMLGPEHIATKMADAGPWAYLKINPTSRDFNHDRGMELVRDFEVPEHRYIS